MTYKNLTAEHAEFAEKMIKFNNDHDLCDLGELCGYIHLG